MTPTTSLSSIWPNLPASAVKVLATLEREPVGDDENLVSLSTECIAEKAGIGVNTASRMISHLIDLGVLEIVSEAKRDAPRVYRIKARTIERPPMDEEVPS